MDDQEQQSPKPAKGYKKLSKLQWILLYVVVAAVVYGLVYWLFFKDSNNTSTTPFGY